MARLLLFFGFWLAMNGQLSQAIGLAAGASQSGKAGDSGKTPAAEPAKDAPKQDEKGST